MVVEGESDPFGLGHPAVDDLDAGADAGADPGQFQAPLGRLRGLDAGLGGLFESFRDDLQAHGYADEVGAFFGLESGLGLGRRRGSRELDDGEECW